jgi:phosphoribosylformimino-5-aminoimidazole carboxamide ribotide isomerase
VDLFPAVDLVGGAAVRLTQGDFARQRRYGDPVVLARRFVDAGARWLHVVDLDAARTGAPSNRDVVVALARALPVAIQTGGGVRRVDDVAELLEAGVARVVMGTAAFEDPRALAEAARRFPGRVALGLDYRRRADGALVPALHGWVQDSDVDVVAALAAVRSLDLGAVVATCIDRDGMLAGPDTVGLRAVLEATSVPVVASGGVTTARDLADLARLHGPSGRRLAGAIVGKSLAEERLSVEAALEACTASG